MKNRLSKSSILLHNHCPRKWKYFKIEKFKPKITPIALTKGIEVHSIFEGANKKQNINEAIKFIKDHPNYDKYWNECVNFIEFISNNGLPLFTEMKIFNEEINVLGIIDAVYKINGKHILIDYKTGKRKKVENFRFELGLYAYLFWKETGIQVDQWGIFFASHKKKEVEDSIEQEVMNSVEEVKTVRGFIEYNTENDCFPKFPGILCKWSTGQCECYEMCKPFED